MKNLYNRLTKAPVDVPVTFKAGIYQNARLTPILQPGVRFQKINTVKNRACYKR